MTSKTTTRSLSRRLRKMRHRTTRVAGLRPPGALPPTFVTSGALVYADYLPDEAALAAFHSAISTHAPAYGISLHAAVFGEGCYRVCFTAGDQSGALLFAMHLDRNICDHLQPRLLGWGDAVEVRRLDRLEGEAAKREAIEAIERLALEVEERRLERAWFSRGRRAS